ncbi:gamma-mobile-trio recombinase GmtY [Psychrosphaera algicola]|uniref:Gamma-mobile-trio recombinase GmtY n=1 Tax=Psychrosphaera algicola TaxID=3023714 RepID=A0ABT5FFK9_9GAMM|nr:gamma-mobile-trio recombinase GmtY [Psychrosphaera sp. G1-22]MDC2890343.1 gamma-mobile-trio recombinase GmtY [Psychrosphaera sp. G1-22]
MSFVHKVKVKYHSTEIGKEFELLGLFTDTGVIISHLRYLAQNYYKSQSWKERSVFSVSLLINYINACQFHFDKTTKLLREFTRSLTTGTIDYENLVDPSGLYWKGRSITDANNILYHITAYTDYLAQQDGYETSRINPFRKANSFEQRLNWCAYYQKQTNVFLNHLSSKSDALIANQKVREINGLVTPHVNQEKAIKFPEEKIEKLLVHGFVVRNKIDYKSQAITMLMHFGGLRKSEVFHLYVSDISLHPVYKDEALVRVFHPEYGVSPDSDFANRQEYLQQTTNYKPRTQYRLTERLYSGWKAPLLTSKKYFLKSLLALLKRLESF